MLRFLKPYLNAILPPSCLCCKGRLISNEQYVCSECLASWPRPHLGDNPHDNRMARLFWGVFPIEGATAAYSYSPEGMLTQTIHTMKYGDRPDLCRMMGKLIAIAPQASELLKDVDILLPVPLSRQRQRERHYNQSELLCQGISSITHHPIITDALIRTHFTFSQTAMTAQERTQNIRGAFSLVDASKIEGKSIAIIDDIITTGSTVMECITMLRNVKDIKITVISLALTNNL